MTGIVVFSDVILPESVIGAGLRGKNMRKNTRAMTQSGYTNTNVVWERTLRQYDIGFVGMPVSTWQTIEGIHEATDAGAYGFLMQDPKDQRVLSTEGRLQPYLPDVPQEVGNIGFGYGVPSYRLTKKYTSIGSTRTRNRYITRPKSAAVVTRNGAPVAPGAGAGQVAIDYLNGTGLVTFVADASQAVAGLTLGATTVVTFANNTGLIAALAPGNRLYLDGCLGTTGAVLNKKSHLITAEAGNTFTIATSTTGLTYTGAGIGYKYAQETEPLAWSGDFYVPVHFLADDLDWELLLGGAADQRLVAGVSIMLMEVRE